MIRLANAETATKPRTEYAVKIGVIYAVILIIMTVGQLYAFEKFIPIIENYMLSGGHGTASLVAGLIVVAEVFALPFLLRMRISPLMRWVSLVCSILAAVIWFKLATVAILETTAVVNSGMLGEKIKIPAGILLLLVSIILLSLSGLSAYGLWPSRKK